MAIEIQAPNPWPKDKFTVFLAGAIDQNTAQDWQKQVVKGLAGYDVVLLNPRRSDWDAEIEQSVNDPAFVEQLSWESRGLEEASYRIFCVLADSKAPITMLELGKHLDDPGCICLEDGFYRSGNWEYEALVHGMPITHSVEDLIEHLKEMLDKQGLKTKTGEKVASVFGPPSTLYHGTFRARLDAIMTNGLGAGGAKTYAQSRTGYVYLAESAAAARRWAADAGHGADVVTLAVDVIKLDSQRLEPDANIKIPEYCPECETPVMDRSDPTYSCYGCDYSFDGDMSWQYKGIVPADAITVVGPAKTATGVIPANKTHEALDKIGTFSGQIVGEAYDLATKNPGNQEEEVTRLFAAQGVQEEEARFLAQCFIQVYTTPTGRQEPDRVSLRQKTKWYHATPKDRVAAIQADGEIRPGQDSDYGAELAPRPDAVYITSSAKIAQLYAKDTGDGVVLEIMVPPGTPLLPDEDAIKEALVRGTIISGSKSIDHNARSIDIVEKIEQFWLTWYRREHALPGSDDESTDFSSAWGTFEAEMLQNSAEAMAEHMRAIVEAIAVESPNLAKNIIAVSQRAAHIGPLKLAHPSKTAADSGAVTDGAFGFNREKNALLDKLKGRPYAKDIRVFGSAAQGKEIPGDIDVFMDRSTLRMDEFSRSQESSELLWFAQKFYGSFDPFVLVSQGTMDGHVQTMLITRNDHGTGWIKAKRAREIQSAAAEHGIPLLDFQSLSTSAKQPATDGLPAWEIDKESTKYGEKKAAKTAAKTKCTCGCTWADHYHLADFGCKNEPGCGCKGWQDAVKTASTTQIVYHGTKFPITSAAELKPGPSGLIWFSSDREWVQSWGKNVVAAKLTFTKPDRFTDSGLHFEELEDPKHVRRLGKKYDAFIIENPNDPELPTNYAVFSPSQITPVEMKTAALPGLTLPPGTKLYRGIGEDVVEAPSASFDGCLWFAESKTMARTYIPSSPGTTITSLGTLCSPPDRGDSGSIQKQLGFQFSNLNYKGERRAQSFQYPKIYGELMADIGPYPKKEEFGEDTDAYYKALFSYQDEQKRRFQSHVMDRLREFGYEPQKRGSDPTYWRYDLKTKTGKDGQDLLLPNKHQEGTVLEFTPTQPLRIFDMTEGGSKEGDLLEPDYREFEKFEQLANEGYDGVKINDFAQVHEHGNVGHTAIGIFPKAVAKVKEVTREVATHPEDLWGDIEKYGMKRTATVRSAGGSALPEFNEFLAYFGGSDEFYREWEPECTKAELETKFDGAAALFSSFKFPLDIYREINLEDGIGSLRIDSIGSSWTWEDEAAYAYAAPDASGEPWTIHGRVNFADVDWFTTIALRLTHFVWDVKEIRLKKQAPVRLIAYRPTHRMQFHDWVDFKARTATAGVADRKAQKSTDTPAFKAWFGNSKVVDDKGRPLPVYHGTKADFDTFDLGMAGSNNDPGMWGTGFYFSPQKRMSQVYGDKIKRLYLSLQNPLIIGDRHPMPEALRELTRFRKESPNLTKEKAAAIRELIISMGYDGVLQYSNGWKYPGQIVAFYPNQIKSVKSNGSFDPDDHRITATAASPTENPAFKAWFRNSIVKDKEGNPLVVYRGEHGVNTTGEDFQSRSPALSFGGPNTANLYAEQPNNRNDKSKNPRVYSCYLRIEKPIVNDGEDPFIDFSRIDDAIGRVDALVFAIKHEASITETNNWDENFSGDHLTVESLLEANPDAVRDLYCNAFVLLDDADLVRALKAKGYDGAIHGPYGEGDHDEIEYKVFDHSQVKSAMGNNGEFDPSNHSVTAAKRIPAYGADWTKPRSMKTLNLDALYNSDQHNEWESINQFADDADKDMADANPNVPVEWVPLQDWGFDREEAGEAGSQEEYIRQLAEQMKAGKLIAPMVFRDGKPADGHHRAAAAWLLGLKLVPTVDMEDVFEEEDEEEPGETDIERYVREFNTTWDNDKPCTECGGTGYPRIPVEDPATGLYPHCKKCSGTGYTRREPGAKVAASSETRSAANPPPGYTAVQYLIALDEYFESDPPWTHGVDELDELAAEQTFVKRHIKLTDLTKAKNRKLPSLDIVEKDMAGQSYTQGDMLLDNDYSVIAGMHRLATMLRDGVTEADVWMRVPTAKPKGPKVKPKGPKPKGPKPKGPKPKGPTQDQGWMGKPGDITETPAFKAWFNGSKVVDDHGRPLRVFHGTTADFDEFSLDTAPEGVIWFSASPEHASTISDSALLPDERPNVMPCYLKIQNPLYVNGTELPEEHEIDDIDAVVEQARAEGKDGVMIRAFRDYGDQTSDTWMAFDPGQVKSAIGNNGDFDPGSKSITAADMSDLPPEPYIATPKEIIVPKLLAGSFFHGTPTANVASIMKKGLKPSRGGGALYLAETFHIAENYREHHDFHGSWTVLEINPRALDQTKMAPDDYEFAEVYTVARPEFHEEYGPDWEKQGWWMSMDEVGQMRFLGVIPPSAIVGHTDIPDRNGDTDDDHELVGKNAAMTSSPAYTPEPDHEDYDDSLTDIPEFKAWFGASKVKDAQGRPLRVYHGTGASFTEFDDAQLGSSTTHRTAKLGFFFTPDPSVADGFTPEPWTWDEFTQGKVTEVQSKMTYGMGANIIPCFLSIKNPYVFECGDFVKRYGTGTRSIAMLRRDLEKKGHDGILIEAASEWERSTEEDGDTFADYNEWQHDQWVAFHSNQIKSALGNTGAFDPESRSITAAAKPELTAFMQDWWKQTTSNPFNPRERVWNDLVVIECCPFDGKIDLGAIRTVEPGQGNASSALEAFLRLADKHRVEVACTPKPFGTKALSTAKLFAWYKRHGFMAKNQGLIYHPKREPKPPNTFIQATATLSR